MNLIMRILAGILACHLYAMSAYVSDVNYDMNYVEFTDYSTENQWVWNDNEDWDFDDDALLVMYDNGTEDRSDDVIIRAIYDRTIFMDAYFIKGRN